MGMGDRIRSTGVFDARRTTGSDEVIDRLFVYATLRQGQTARSLIANQIAKCAKASTAGAIYVFPMGYAGFIEADEPRRVIGELLWLTDLAATFGLLDAYEGQDFARVLKQIRLETGELVWSWLYALADREAIKHGVLIEHGDWVRYLAEQGALGAPK
jgi:gamma-glutamylcyclotransferase (GGCT)/AIG2-like uncharacterized protein YtfP